MMAIQIPLRSDLIDYDLQVSLDGTTYTLRFRFNPRSSGWYMDVQTEDGDPILMGKRVVIDMPLGYRCRDPRFWPGLLLAVDTSQQHADPQTDSDLGDRVVLIYWTAAELPINPNIPPTDA